MLFKCFRAFGCDVYAAVVFRACVDVGDPCVVAESPFAVAGGTEYAIDDRASWECDRLDHIVARRWIAALLVVVDRNYCYFVQGRHDERFVPAYACACAIGVGPSG